MPLRRPLALAALALAAAGPAAAHHPMGGETPGTFAQGLLSGVGHPVIGPDHLAFVLVMGLAAAAAGRLRLAPLAFLAASALGVLLAASGQALPLVEPLTAASALVLGGLVLAGRPLAPAPAAALFAAAGLVHGQAYGAAVIGAEPTPVLAYLLGLSLTHYALALAAGALALRLRWAAASPPLRLAGGLAAGLGAALLLSRLGALPLAA